MNALLATIRGSGNPRRGRSSSGGFTLFELVVVMSVMAAAAAVAMPAYQAHRVKSEHRRAVFQICSDLYEARAQAIRTRQDCAVDFARTPAPPAVENWALDTPNSSGIPTNLTDIGVRLQFAGNPGDGTAEVFTDRIEFQANGTLTSMGASQVYIENPRGAVAIEHMNRYRIQVAPAGGISVMRWDTQNNIWVD